MAIRRDDLLIRLEDLSLLRGVSGQEDEVRRYLAERLRGKVDLLEKDALGNLIVGVGLHKKGPRVMAAAHMDEVGLLIHSIEENGLLRFRKVGGIDDRILLSKPVLVGPDRVPGVIGAKPIHLQEPGEREKAVSWRDMAVDIGAKDKAEAEKYVQVGHMATFLTEFGPFGEGRVKGKAFDDRAGCAVLLSLLEEEWDGPFFGVFTVQEEIGLRGARTAAYRVDPHYAVVLEGTPAADIPRKEGETSSTELGKGPAISFMDRSSIAHPGLVKELIQVAEREGIPWQWRRTQGGGNDAGAIHLTRKGVPSVSISVPCRYIHTPVSVLDPEDLWNTARLARAFIRELFKKGDRS